MNESRESELAKFDPHWAGEGAAFIAGFDAGWGACMAKYGLTDWSGLSEDFPVREPS